MVEFGRFSQSCLVGLWLASVLWLVVLQLGRVCAVDFLKLISWRCFSEVFGGFCGPCRV